MLERGSAGADRLPADESTVTIDDATVPRDPSHTLGWDYTDATGRSITLYGAWCERVHAATAYRLAVYYGCPTPG